MPTLPHDVIEELEDESFEVLPLETEKDAEIQCLQARMLNIENALQQVIQQSRFPSRESRAVDPDWAFQTILDAGDVSFECNLDSSPESNRERQRFLKLVNQYQQELRDIQRNTLSLNQ